MSRLFLICLCALLALLGCTTPAKHQQWAQAAARGDAVAQRNLAALCTAPPDCAHVGEAKK